MAKNEEKALLVSFQMHLSSTVIQGTIMCFVQDAVYWTNCAEKPTLKQTFECIVSLYMVRNRLLDKAVITVKTDNV